MIRQRFVLDTSALTDTQTRELEGVILTLQWVESLISLRKRASIWASAAIFLSFRIYRDERICKE